MGELPNLRIVAPLAATPVNAAAPAAVNAALAALTAALAALAVPASLTTIAAVTAAVAAVAATVAALLDHLLGDHLLRRGLSKRHWLEPQLLR